MKPAPFEYHSPRSLEEALGLMANLGDQARPAAEWPLCAMLLDGIAHVDGPRGARQVASRDLFQGAFSTALDDGELMTEIRFALPPPRSGSAFLEVARRHGDFALGAAAA